MKSFKSLLLTFWQERNLREQKLLGLLALMASVALFCSLLWWPAATQVPVLEQQLTSLRAQHAQMQSMLRELQGSQQAAATAVPAGAQLGEALGRSLADAGLSAKRIEAATQSQWRVEISDAPFSALADWQSRIRSEWKVTLVEGSFDRNPTPGNVRARLLLQGEGH
jgi:type II secretory pathway component PulM